MFNPQKKIILAEEEEKKIYFVQLPSFNRVVTPVVALGEI